MSPETLHNVIYRAALLVASFLFLVGLRGLSRAGDGSAGTHSRRSECCIGVVGTLFHHDIVQYQWILGGSCSAPSSAYPMGLWIPMTRMPERIALSHAFGGLAVATVGVAEFLHEGPAMSRIAAGAVSFEVLMGAITFTGSLIAFGKLQGSSWPAPVTFPGNNTLNFVLLAAPSSLLVLLVRKPGDSSVFLVTCARGASPRLASGAAHRRRRHAGRHLPAQRLRWPRRVGVGVRPRQQRAHHLRRA